MNSVRALGTGLVALLFFSAVVGLCQGLAAANAQLSPALPWFPLPALALLALAVGLARRRWELRLSHPDGVPWGRAYGFAFLGTLAALGISTLEAAFNGLERSAPAWPGVEEPVFNLLFLFTLPFVAAVMAEVVFRGIIQTRLEKLWPLWVVLLFVAVVNALMHFYDPDQMSQWARFLSLNGVWGYITWRSQSLWPALAAHVAMNVVEPVTELWLGPTDMATLPPVALILAGLMTLTAGGAALSLLRGWRPAQAL